MSFFSFLFGSKKKETPATPATPAASAQQRSSYMYSRSSSVYVPRKMKCAQVYEGRPTEPPEWAKGVNNNDMPAAISEHLVCNYVPHFGYTKIMSVNKGADGNLIPDFEGVAGDCGAIKNFGGKVAARDGQEQPYKYVDTNMAFRACCGIPKKCPFYMSAMGDELNLSQQRR